MSVSSYTNTAQVVKVGPSLRERLERWLAAQHHKTMIARLQRFREEMESDMEPDAWTDLEAPMVALLADVCNALALNKEEQAIVLGQLGEQALAGIKETRFTPHYGDPLNERQPKAMAYVREHGAISLSAYRVICPQWSDETLRLDLADLVERGLLSKNGRNRGMRYMLAA